MEQIINTILEKGNSVEIILSLIILGIVGIGIMYLRTLRKAAKNDYHTLPEHTEAIRDELRMLRTESNNAHNKTIEILSRMDGKMSK